MHSVLHIKKAWECSSVRPYHIFFSFCWKKDYKIKEYGEGCILYYLLHRGTVFLTKSALFKGNTVLLTLGVNLGLDNFHFRPFKFKRTNFSFT